MRKWSRATDIAVVERDKNVGHVPWCAIAYVRSPHTMTFKIGASRRTLGNSAKIFAPNAAALTVLDSGRNLHSRCVLPTLGANLHTGEERSHVRWLDRAAAGFQGGFDESAGLRSDNMGIWRKKEKKRNLVVVVKGVPKVQRGLLCPEKERPHSSSHSLGGTSATYLLLRDSTPTTSTFR